MKWGEAALLSFVEHETDDVKKGLKEVTHAQPFFGVLQHLPQPCAMGTLWVYQRNDGPCMR